MIFNLFLILFLAFEIQKLIQFKLFFRLTSIGVDYREKVLKRIESTAYNELIKFSLINFVYLVIVIIGIFSENIYYFSGLIFLSLLRDVIFLMIKNKTIRKILYIIDIILSIILLTLIIINIYS